MSLSTGKVLSGIRANTRGGGDHSLTVLLSKTWHSHHKGNIYLLQLCSISLASYCSLQASARNVCWLAKKEVHQLSTTDYAYEVSVTPFQSTQVKSSELSPQVLAWLTDLLEKEQRLKWQRWLQCLQWQSLNITWHLNSVLLQVRLYFSSRQAGLSFLNPTIATGLSRFDTFIVSVVSKYKSCPVCNATAAVTVSHAATY